MKQFESIEQMLDLELQTIALKQITPIEKAKQSIQACSDCLKRIKAIMAAHSFDQESKEIRFFKYMKPRILAKQLYYIYVRNLEEYISFIDDKSKLKYFRKKLKKIRAFQKKNDDFIKYYKSEQTYMDTVIFKRLTIEDVEADEPELLQYDAAFCTSHDCKAAKIIAKEELSTYIAKKVVELTGSVDASSLGKCPFNFQWTDKKAALFELIYALANSGSINAGKVEISELASFFSWAFNIDLSDIYHAHTDMKARKTDQTKYLTHLINCLIKRLNN